MSRKGPAPGTVGRPKADIARVALDAITAGRLATAAVADTFSVNRRTAASMISRCRRAGYDIPTQRGNWRAESEHSEADDLALMLDHAIACLDIRPLTFADRGPDPTRGGRPRGTITTHDELIGGWAATDPTRAAEADPSWRDRALCRGLDARLFFAERGESVQDAKALCRACPVCAECRDFAVDNCEPVGVWGATTPQERQRLRTRREAA